MQPISIQKLFLLYWDPGQHNSMLQAMLVALKKLYMDPYPPSVHLCLSIALNRNSFHSNAHGDYYS